MAEATSYCLVLSHVWRRKQWRNQLFTATKYVKKQCTGKVNFQQHVEEMLNFQAGLCQKPLVFLTFLSFSYTPFTFYCFLQVFMGVGVHSGIPHMLISVPTALSPGTICPSYWTPFSADDIVWYLSLHISHHYPPLSGFFPWAKTFLLAALNTIWDNAFGRAGLSYLWHLNCGGNVQHMLEMLLYSNVWPMALHLYQYFYQQRDSREHY